MISLHNTVFTEHGEHRTKYGVHKCVHGVPFTADILSLDRLVDVDQVGQPVHRLLVDELNVLLRELRLRWLRCNSRVQS